MQNTIIPCPICVEGKTSQDLMGTIQYLIDFWYNYVGALEDNGEKPGFKEHFERVKYLDRRIPRS